MGFVAFRTMNYGNTIKTMECIEKEIEELKPAPVAAAYNDYRTILVFKQPDNMYRIQFRDKYYTCNCLNSTFASYYKNMIEYALNIEVTEDDIGYEDFDNDNADLEFSIDENYKKDTVLSVAYYDTIKSQMVQTKYQEMKLIVIAYTKYERVLLTYDDRHETWKVCIDITHLRSSARKSFNNIIGYSSIKSDKDDNSIRYAIKQGITHLFEIDMQLKDNDVYRFDNMCLEEIQKSLPQEEKEMASDNKVYQLITICSSMRFKKEIEEAHKMLTLKGWIVLLPCPFYPDDNPDYPLSTTGKNDFMAMHYQRIRMSDAVYVINKDGYIGESVAEEVKYAAEQGKKIIYYDSNPKNYTIGYMKEKEDANERLGD